MASGLMPGKGLVREFFYDYPLVKKQKAIENGDL